MINPKPFSSDINERKAFYFDRFQEAYEIYQLFTAKTIEISESPCLSQVEKLNEIKKISEDLKNSNRVFYKKHYDNSI